MWTCQFILQQQQAESSENILTEPHSHIHRSASVLVRISVLRLFIVIVVITVAENATTQRHEITNKVYSCSFKLPRRSLLASFAEQLPTRFTSLHRLHQLEIFYPLDVCHHRSSPPPPLSVSCSFSWALWFSWVGFCVLVV